MLYCCDGKITRIQEDENYIRKLHSYRYEYLLKFVDIVS